MSKFILGGGIAGLITAYYNPEYTIISDNIGGQMGDTGLGPRILEVNEWSTLLLEDLGYGTVPIKTAKIGYMFRDRYLLELTAGMKENYYKKSRFLDKIMEVPNSVMSDGKKEIRYFDIDWNVLIGKLIDGIKTDAILCKVEDIDVVNQVITVDNVCEYEYDTLITTLPAPLFFNKLAKVPPEEKLVSVPKTFIITKEFFDMNDFDYVYFPGDDVEYHRVTKIGNGLVAVEYTTTRSQEDILNEWPNAINSKHIPFAQIQSGKTGHIENVYYVGRFACWDHGIKTDDVVLQANLLKKIDDVREENFDV